MLVLFMGRLWFFMGFAWFGVAGSVAANSNTLCMLSHEIRCWEHS